MMEVFITRTRVFYPPYVDLLTMAHVSGMQTCFVDEIDVTREAVYICFVINGEHRPHLTNYRNKVKKAILVHWNLERQGHAGMGDLVNYMDAVWTSCQYYETVINHSRCMWVPLGSEEDLAHYVVTNIDELQDQKTNDIHWEEVEDKEYSKQFDFIHLSYLVYRRSLVTNHLGWTQPPEQDNCWGMVRHERLKQSRFMLNIHQDDLLMQEPQRISLAAAYGLPYLSEHTPNPCPLVSGVHYEDLPYGNKGQDMIMRIQQIKGEPYERYAAMGMELHDQFCHAMPFHENVQRGVEVMLKAREEEGKFRVTW